ncbi:MAG: hypothetical protein PHW76_08070 [Alphaproteobacteria bacterium]|nr:hypothetical protein [Alphaproteobacteria bacterium]
MEAEQVDILVHLYPFAEDSASILFAKAAADKGGKGISVGDVHFGVSDAGDPWVQIGKAKYSAEEAQNLIVEFINGRTKRETDVRVTIEGIEKIGGEDYLFSDLVISGNFKKNERFDLYNILSGPPVDNYLPKSSENLLKPKAATLTFEGGAKRLIAAAISYAAGLEVSTKEVEFQWEPGNRVTTFVSKKGYEPRQFNQAEVEDRITTFLNKEVLQRESDIVVKQIVSSEVDDWIRYWESQIVIEGALSNEEKKLIKGVTSGRFSSKKSYRAEVSERPKAGGGLAAAEAKILKRDQTKEPERCDSAKNKSFWNRFFKDKQP